jgi:hypothetical protein
MPKNSQGNNYSTPGGSNSNQGDAYHCKCLFRFGLRIQGLSSSSQQTSCYSSFVQIPTRMVATTIRTIMVANTITMGMDFPSSLQRMVRTRVSFVDVLGPSSERYTMRHIFCCLSFANDGLRMKHTWFID